MLSQQSTGLNSTGKMVYYYKYVKTNSKDVHINAKQFAKDNNFRWFYEEIILNGQLYGYPEDVTALTVMDWYESFTVTLNVEI
jgi:hypothetical protein